MEKGKYPQLMVLEKLNIYMRNKGPQPLPHNIHKNQFEKDHRLKHKS